MKLTEGELNQIIVSMRPTQIKYPEDNDVAYAVVKKLIIKSIDSIKLIVKTQMKSLK